VSKAAAVVRVSRTSNRSDVVVTATAPASSLFDQFEGKVTASVDVLRANLQFLLGSC
jgi:hypothetical protein